MDIVEALSSDGPASARAISRATGIPESSLSYLLATLLEREWISLAPDRTYSVGPALARLGAGVRPPLEMRRRSALKLVMNLTGETTSLFVRRLNEIEVIDAQVSSHALRFTPQKGMRVPLHSFAAGKALLAALPPDLLDRYFAENERERMTANTLVGEAELRKDLDDTRLRGYALANEEHILGVVGISVALDMDSAMSVAIPTPRFSADLEKHVTEVLRHVAKTLVA